MTAISHGNRDITAARESMRLHLGSVGVVESARRIHHTAHHLIPTHTYTTVLTLQPKDEASCLEEIDVLSRGNSDAASVG